MSFSAYSAKRFHRAYAFWGTFPRLYHAQDWFTMLGAQRRIRSEVVGMLGDVRGQTVLDAGCGTGSNLEALSNAVGPSGRIIAVDVHPAMLQSAHHTCVRQGLANVDVVEASLDSLLVETASIDAVFAMMSLSVVEDTDCTLAEFHRVLRPNGAFVVSDGRAFKHGLSRVANPILENVYAPLGAWFPKRDFSSLNVGWRLEASAEYVGGGFYASAYRKR